MKLTENARIVLERRCLAKDPETGAVIETPEEMVARVAGTVADAELNYVQPGYTGQKELRDHWYRKFYEMIDSLDFLPNSPTLVNAGRPLGQLSACFVLPVEDDMNGIFDTVKNTALIHQSGGGTGFSFSRLRPKNSRVASTGGTASGPVSFMQVFNQSTEVIKQGGCFVGETLVMTNTGPVMIMDLRAGMMVMSMDYSGKIIYTPCTDPFLTKRDVSVVSVTIGNDAVICTPDHPFMVEYKTTPNGGGEFVYKRAIELQPGDAVISHLYLVDDRCKVNTNGKANTDICTWDAPADVITTCKVEAVTMQHATRDVWNVEVPGTHNYAVCSVYDSKPRCAQYIYHCTFVSNTRRGANMGLLRVDHPDIMEFITCKNDLNTLNNFNLSVGITDAFMEALRDNKSYDLVDPHTKTVTGTLKAKDVWDTIVHSAWATGEPGIVFLDEINKYNPFIDVIGPIEATNPCVAGWTRLMTDKGEVEIREVVDTEINVWNGEVYSTVTPRVTGENQPSLIVSFSGEYDSVFCTPYHKFITATGKRVEAKDLKVGDVLHAWKTPDGAIENTYITNITSGPILDKVYCFTEPLLHQGMFNGVVLGNCGEQPLLPYESCNLGSINLANFVYRSEPSGKPVVDYRRLDEVTAVAVRFLDNVIDVNRYPLQEINDMTKNTRKIGLGVMGFADMLLKLGIPYNSVNARNIATSVMSTIESSAHSASFKLYQERGGYPLYDVIDHDDVLPHRNATCTTIAPTGTLSIIAGVSSGIEPVFAYAFYRKVLDDDKLAEINPVLLDMLKLRSLDKPEIIDEIITKGSLAHVDAIPEDIKRVFVSAHDISPEDHVKMQAAFQAHVDNAVSKTVNFTHDATEEQIATAYQLAYELGCKGITVYRDGSREGQTLNLGKKDETPVPTVVKPASINADYIATGKTDIPPIRQQPRERNECLEGFTRKVDIGCGKLYVTVNHDNDGICEVFTTTGKTGGCPSQSEAVARITSIALRAGVPLDEIIEQLRGIRCQSCIHKSNVHVLSCPDAIARQLEYARVMYNQRALDDIVEDPRKIEIETISQVPAANKESTTVCPNCGAKLEHESGCVICRNCGYSKCG